MNKKRLFAGFSTNSVKPGNTKTVLYDIDLVKRDIMNQFMTRKGERVMLPKYGTTIWEQLFEPFTDVVKNSIIRDVVDVINSEPRVTLQSLNVYTTEHGIAVDSTVLFTPWDVIDSFNMLFDSENQPLT